MCRFCFHIHIYIYIRQESCIQNIKNSYRSTRKRHTTQFCKNGQKHEQDFHKTRIFKWLIIKMQKERYLMSLLIRQMQIKTTQVYHHTTIERPKMKTRSKSTVGEDMEKWEPYHVVGEDVKYTTL